MKIKTIHWNNLEDKKKISHSEQFKFIEKNIKYTNLNILKKFLTKFGKIKSNRKTFFRSKYHRFVAKTIKRSRNSNLIPTKSFIKIN